MRQGAGQRYIYIGALAYQEGFQNQKVEVVFLDSNPD